VVWWAFVSNAHHGVSGNGIGGMPMPPALNL
jgi:hypothetical protein